MAASIDDYFLGLKESNILKFSKSVSLKNDRTANRASAACF